MRGRVLSLMQVEMTRIVSPPEGADGDGEEASRLYLTHNRMKGKETAKCMGALKRD